MLKFYLTSGYSPIHLKNFTFRAYQVQDIVDRAHPTGDSPTSPATVTINIDTIPEADETNEVRVYKLYSNVL